MLVDKFLQPVVSMSSQQQQQETSEQPGADSTANELTPADAGAAAAAAAAAAPSGASSSGQVTSEATQQDSSQQASANDSQAAQTSQQASPAASSPNDGSTTATVDTGMSAQSATSKVKSATQQAGGSSAQGSRASSPAQTSSRHGGRSRKRLKLGELDISKARIGFLGAGKMTESTINGLIHYAKISPDRIHVAAPTTKNLERFKALGCHVTKRNYDIFGRYNCDIIFLAFHGYVIKHCFKLGGARPHPLTTNYIPHQSHPIYILSLVGGVSLSQIKQCLLNPESTNRYQLEIHRIMMNTAVGHGLGICAIDCEPDSRKLSPPLRQLLSSIAHLEHVPASQMDAACAIGGSGLAFSYYFINALADGAFRMGLSRVQAIRFASKTAQCAAQTMLESGKHPAELRDSVSSPSGAAIYGIHVLEKNDVASGVTAAVEAAHKRANDLATQET